MGVKGLWKLLKTVSRPIPLELLEGKALAVDISIWLNQALKAGNDAPHAHLLVLFHRICKLLFCRVRPIFVFDGKMPQLKMLALEKRRKQKSLALKKASKFRLAYAEKLAKKSLVEAHLYPNNQGNSAVEIAPSSPVVSLSSEDETLADRPVEYIEDYLPQRATSDTEDEEGALTTQDMDLDSEDFLSLPKEVQHEVIRERISERKSRHNFARGNFPEDDEAFSRFQFSRLLEKGALTRRLDSIRRDMVQRDVATATQHLELDGGEVDELIARRVVSQDEGHVILLKMKQSQVDTQPESEEEEEQEKEIVVAKKNNVLLLSSDDEEVEEEPVKEVEQINEPKEQVEDDERVEIQGPLDYSGLEAQLNWRESDEEEEEDDLPSMNHKVTKLLNDMGEDVPVEMEEEEIDLVDAVRSATSRLLAASTNVQPIPPPSPPHDTEKEPAPEVISVSSASEESDEWEEVTETEPVPIPVVEPPPQPIPPPALPKVDAEELHQILENVNAWQQEIQSELDTLSREERRLREQGGNPLNEQYVEDAKQLLRLFGIPFVVSPQEAEAQCAKLEELQLCDGIITEDSDVWLFGAKRVYKNLFRQDRYVEAHDAHAILSRLGLNRSRLIAIGLLCGSDYTEGVPGIGPVSAIELLAEFPAENGFDSLRHFAQWHAQVKSQKGTSSVPTRKRLLKYELSADFPSRHVYDAYISPQVDDSGDVFSWSKPDIHLLRDFVKHRFGWNQQRADDVLLPVMRRLEDRSVQPKITSFFYVSPQKNVEDIGRQGQGSPGKRVNRAISRLNRTSPEEDSVDSVVSKSRTKKATQKSRPEEEDSKAPTKPSRKRKVTDEQKTKGKTPNTTTTAQKRTSKRIKANVRKVSSVDKSETCTKALNLSSTDSDEEIDEYIRNMDFSQLS